MHKTIDSLVHGYREFKEKYAQGDDSVMKRLAYHGQNPEIMVVACCDSRVDPALILQCDPGDLFVARNVANIVPPFESDGMHHGTSAALEFGICYLNVKHLIILGHHQCGGINALLNSAELHQNDFITNWVSQINKNPIAEQTIDDVAKDALTVSYENCLTFPWIKQRVDDGSLAIHLWFFDIEDGEIYHYEFNEKQYLKLSSCTDEPKNKLSE